MFTDIRIKIQNFFKHNKRKIIIILIVWAIIFAINIIVGKIQDIQPPKVSYDAKTPIVEGSSISTKTYEKTENVINDYIKYCNEKDYENAYNLITDDCKEIKFNNKLENFEKYVESIFTEYKVASIQSYSNKDNTYVYKVTISEDLIATGRNNGDYKTYNEMIVAYKDDTSKISLGGFIKKETLDYVNQDDYLRVWLEEKYTYYDKVTYKVKIKNLSIYPIVLSNQTETTEILLSLNGDNRDLVVDNYVNHKVTIGGGSTNTYEMTFNKYFDETRKETSLIFNKIRVLSDYSGIDENWEEELKNSIKKYSLEIPLNK